MAGGKLKHIGEGIAGGVAIAASFITPFLNSRRMKWDATDDEACRTLPGDDLVPHSKGGYTHAITIRASTAQVWPWLNLRNLYRVQMPWKTKHYLINCGVLYLIY